MTAVLCDEVVTTPPPASLTLEPVPARKRLPRQPVASGDPLVDAAARLLSIPLRQVYAVLWRVGVIEVTA